METLSIKLNGIAVDVLSDEWLDEDVINKSPIILQKVEKRKGGFTLYMKAPTENIEWYFSRGLTIIQIKQGSKGKFLHIEHEDGLYWVDLPAHPELIKFLKEFMEEEG
ncbi:hypothetical protein [Persephonella sp.]